VNINGNFLSTNNRDKMIYHYIKMAIRNIAKNRLYSFLIIGGFAIGFTACLLVGLFYQTETTVNHDFANHQRMYRLYDTKMNRCNLNWDLYPVILSEYPSVQNACPMDYSTGMTFILKDEQDHTYAEVKHLVCTTNQFFDLFSVQILESQSGKPLDGLESMAISRSMAQKLFPSQNPLGRRVNIANNFTGTITAIFSDLPPNSSFQAELIMNSENRDFRMNNTCNKGKCYNPTNLFLLLKEGTQPEMFTAELNKSATLRALDTQNLALQKFDDIYLSELKVKSQHAKGNPTLLKVFLAIAGLILLLSTINYLNYSISMQFARLKVTGINKSLGARWKDLLKYALTEVSTGVLVSMVISFALTLMVLPYTGRLFGKVLQVSWSGWLPVAPFFLGAVMVVVLISSIAPLYILSKFKITEFLSGFRGKLNRKQIGKQALLIFQLTASIALIAIVMIIFRQLGYMKHADFGFNREMLVRIDIPYEFSNTDALKQEIDKLPFTENSSLSQGCPGMINNKYGSNSGENSFDVNCIPVAGNYLETMGIELIAGRNFLDGDLKKACLINEEALKQYGWESFEGQKFNNGQEGGFQVIGIVKDFHFESFHSKVEPLALLFDGAPYGNVLSVRLSPGNTGQQIDRIGQIWKTISPYEPMNLMFYDDFFQSMYAREEKLAGSITFFSIIAIVLTCMGILGQIFMICMTRVKEIGIRKINGARVSEILLLLNRDFLKWVAIGFVIATPLAYYAMHRWLENFAYKTGLSWWIFALAGLLALGIALLTVSWQSWKAATRNPVEALRYE
jgi:putative ABC transport system permease protein